MINRYLDTDINVVLVGVVLTLYCPRNNGPEIERQNNVSDETIDLPVHSPIACRQTTWRRHHWRRQINAANNNTIRMVSKNGTETRQRLTVR